MTATQAAPPRVQGQAAVPVGGGRAWPGFEPTRQATRQRPGPTGVEGAGGICRGAGGRRRGLAGLRPNAPNHTSVHQTPPVWRAPEGPEGTGGLRDRPLRAAGSRVAISRAGRRPPAHTAAGPSGARNTRGATQQHSHTVAGPSGARNTSSARNTSGATRHLGITKPPGPTGAGRLSQHQRLIAGPQQCRGLRGRSPGERWKYRAWRQRPSRFPPCGDPRRRRWRSAWPSRRRSRRRCLRSRPG